MEVSYTNKDVARKLFPNADSVSVEHLAERIKQWTKLGYLDPVTDRHGGRGRWRRYDRSGVMWATALQHLQNLNAPPEVMKLAGKYLRHGLTGNSNDAAASTKSHPFYEIYSLARKGIQEAASGQRQVYWVINLRKTFGPTGRAHKMSLDWTQFDNPEIEGSAYVLDLTGIFRSVA